MNQQNNRPLYRVWINTTYIVRLESAMYRFVTQKYVEWCVNLVEVDSHADRTWRMKTTFRFTNVTVKFCGLAVMVKKEYGFDQEFTIIVKQLAV